MIIVFSNSQDLTADYICSRLVHNKKHHIRLNSDNLIEEVSLSYSNGSMFLKVNEQKLVPDSITCVLFRRPKLLKFPQQWQFEKGEKVHTLSEWSAALGGFLSLIPQQLWINHPNNNLLASSKLEQLSRAKKNGLTIPKTLVTQSWDEAIQFWDECKEKIIVKPLSHGYIERDEPEQDTIIYTNKVTKEALYKNQKSLAFCPTFFQEKIDKLCDVRINVIDELIVATAIYPSHSSSLQTIDIRRDSMQAVQYKSIDLPLFIKNNLLQLCHSYKLRFAAIDMAINKDFEWIFFEINPNGQWAWLDIEGVTDIAKLLLKAMQRSFSHE